MLDLPRVSAPRRRLLALSKARSETQAGLPRIGCLFVDRSFTQHPARMFLAQSVGDVFVGETDKFGKRRVRAT